MHFSLLHLCRFGAAAGAREQASFSSPLDLIPSASLEDVPLHKKVATHAEVPPCADVGRRMAVTSVMQDDVVSGDLPQVEVVDGAAPRGTTATIAISVAATVAATVGATVATADAAADIATVTRRCSIGAATATRPVWGSPGAGTVPREAGTYWQKEGGGRDSCSATLPKPSRRGNSTP